MQNANLVTRAMMTYESDVKKRLITQHWPSDREQHLICASENPCEGPAVSRGTFMRHIDLGDGAP